MKTIRIFISSPDDVADERQKACDVIASLQPRYAGRFLLVAVRSEELPLQEDMTARQGIDLVLSPEHGLDIAVLILWSQLGSPPDASGRKGGGAEREFQLVLASREASGGTRPAILAYTRDDPDGFLDRQKGQPPDLLEDMLRERQLAEDFIAAHFADASAGSKTCAHHTYTKPVEFAHRLRVHVREILDGLLGDGGGATWDVSEMGAPFRGLDAFEPQHAGIFFGREDEICAVQLALRHQAAAGCAFVLIVGASGSGKSSLARAGVLPAVTQFDVDETVRAWRHAIFIPGTSAKDLCAGLARVLCSALPELRESGTSPDALAAGLREDPALFCRLVLPNALGAGVRLFLLLDQFEELFSHSAIGPDDRAVFSVAVDALARSGSVWVLATVRSDFYDQCQTLPRLMAMKGARGQFDLLVPDADDLRRIITAPASLAGLRFEKDASTGEALDRRLLDDATRHPEALPLLEYALRELFERREPDGMLTLAQYHELGGVEGALGHRAEAVFLALPLAVQAALDGVLSSLVTLREDTDAGATRARVTTESAASTPERAKLIAAFVKERLFFTDRDASTGEPILTLSHEALLRCWPRASQWIERNRDFLRVRARLREGVRAWNENARAADYLLSPGKPLEDARTILAARGDDLAHAEREFIEASLAHAEGRERAVRRKRRLAFTAMVFLTAIAVAGGAFAMIQTKVARDAASSADTQRKLAVEATERATAQASALEQSEAEARAAKKTAEDATEQAKAQALLAEQQKAEATDARKEAEQKLKDALAIVDYLRVDVPKQLAEKSPSTVLQTVLKKAADFYDRLGLDENDPAQLVRRAEDAMRAGDTQMETGDLKAAALNYETALKLSKQLTARDATNDGWQMQWSVSLAKVGDVQMALENFEEAKASYEEALRIRRQLIERDANNRNWQLSLSVIHDKLGGLGMKMRDSAGATAHYGEEQKILKQLAAVAGDEIFQRSLAVSSSSVGDHRRAQGDMKGAAESYGEAMRILQELTRRNPESSDVQRELSRSFTKAGSIEQDQENLAGAAKNFLQAVEILRKLAASDPENADWQLAFSTSLVNVASVQHKQRDLVRAEKNFAKAVEIVEALRKAEKLSEAQASWPEIFRDNLEKVRAEIRQPKK